MLFISIKAETWIVSILEFFKIFFFRYRAIVKKNLLVPKFSDR